MGCPGQVGFNKRWMVLVSAVSAQASPAVTLYNASVRERTEPNLNRSFFRYAQSKQFPNGERVSLPVL